MSPPEILDLSAAHLLDLRDYERERSAAYGPALFDLVGDMTAVMAEHTARRGRRSAVHTVDTDVDGLALVVLEVASLRPVVLAVADTSKAYEGWMARWNGLPVGNGFIFGLHLEYDRAERGFAAWDAVRRLAEIALSYDPVAVGTDRAAREAVMEALAYARIPARHAADWYSAGIPGEDACRYHAAGMSPEHVTGDWGFAARWGEGRQPQDVADLFATGISAADAKAWMEQVYWPDERVSLIKAGYTREQAKALFWASLRPEGASNTHALAKVRASFADERVPVEDACAAIAAGISPQEAVAPGMDRQAVAAMAALRAWA